MPKKRPDGTKTAAQVAVDSYREKRGEFAHTRVFNDKSLFLEEVDGRTGPAKRFKELYGEITNDIGGREHISEAQRQLARRAATLAAIAESMEALWVVGAPTFALNEYITLTNALNRVFGVLGIERKPREMGSLDKLIEAVAAEGT